MNTSKRNMIFFDIDGTLLPEGTAVIPKSTKTALQMAREKGNLIFINTGRTYFNVDDFIKELGFDGYICGCGTYIYCQEKALLAQTIPHERCVRLVELLRECKIPAAFEENEHIYFDTDENAPTTAFLEESRRYFGIRAFDLPEDIYDPSFTFDKILAIIEPYSDVERFRAYSDEFLEYIDRGRNMAEIIQKGYSKATGIDFVCRYFDIPLTNCYAIGDSTNDLSMLEYVPYSIAMGNSADIVKEKCSYVTDSVDNDGIYNALKHFELI